jgi:SAM-dependent methyltransferase
VPDALAHTRPRTSAAPPGPLLRLADRARDARLRAVYTLALWLDKSRAALGLRRGRHAGGVYYKELSPVRLARALSRRGPGHKDYRVTFPGGAKQVIRASHARCYADLTGAEGVHRYVRLAHAVRPGSRVLEVAAPPALTGYTADYLGALVGPSGAVVALVPDEEGARFAQARYARDNVGVEHLPGPLEGALAGETNGAFDAAIALGLDTLPEGPEHALRELWRALAPAGWLAVGLTSDDDGDRLRAALSSLTASLTPSAHAATLDAGLAILHKPHDAPPSPPPRPPTPATP